MAPDLGQSSATRGGSPRSSRRRVVLHVQRSRLADAGGGARRSRRACSSAIFSPSPRSAWPTRTATLDGGLGEAGVGQSCRARRARCRARGRRRSDVGAGGPRPGGPPLAVWHLLEQLPQGVDGVPRPAARHERRTTWREPAPTLDERAQPAHSGMPGAGWVVDGPPSVGSRARLLPRLDQLGTGGHYSLMNSAQALDDERLAPNCGRQETVTTTTSPTPRTTSGRRAPRAGDRTGRPAAALDVGPRPPLSAPAWSGNPRLDQPDDARGHPPVDPYVVLVAEALWQAPRRWNRTGRCGGNVDACMGSELGARGLSSARAKRASVLWLVSRCRTSLASCAASSVGDGHPVTAASARRRRPGRCASAGSWEPRRGQPGDRRRRRAGTVGAPPSPPGRRAISSWSRRDEVPPHEQVLVERRPPSSRNRPGPSAAASRRPAGGREQRRRGHPAPATTGALDGEDPVLEPRSSGRRPGPSASATSTPTSGEDAAAARSRAVELAHDARWRARRPPRAPAGRRGARSARPGRGRRRAARSRAVRRAARGLVGGASEWEIPRPAVIRLSSPGRISRACRRCRGARCSPPNSQLTVCNRCAGAARRAYRRPPRPARSGRRSTRHRSADVACGRVRRTVHGAQTAEGTSRASSRVRPSTASRERTFFRR